MKVITSEAEAYQFVISLIYQRCGIRLHEGKEQLIKSRLGKRIRHYGMQNLADYCQFLRTQADEDEFTLVIDALTTNFTQFLREQDHFEFMVQHALPAVLPKGLRRFQIWSAASSTGEEPYTIAMFLSEYFPPARGWDWRVLASDISTKVLAAAQRGIYTEDRVRAIPEEWLPRYFQRGLGPWAGHYRVKSALSERVTFCQINLIESYQHRDPFELIFCRNAMIYFDRPTQEVLVHRLCQFLRPQGHLLIGHSESLTGLNVSLRCIRPSIYQRA